MIIELKEIKLKEIIEGFHEDPDTNQVVGYDGQLNIRPKFQREFVYKDDKKIAVIDTIINGYPLNTMYWSYNENNEGSDRPVYELLDGQQRTLSALTYIKSKFSYNELFFHNQPDDIKEKILNYPLQIYICYGNDSEKLAWFHRINIKGEPLNDQELRNSTYTGPWLEDAKRYFSRPTSAARDLGKGYVKGEPIRQDILEIALDWISNRDGLTIENYMGLHQDDKSAIELWTYYQAVLDWAKRLFPKIRKEMSTVNWGYLYNIYSGVDFDPLILEKTVSDLMLDDEVKNKKGIYLYVFDGKEKHLNLRSFTNSQKAELYELQQGECMICHEHFDRDDMEADHITPWSLGGKTEISNGQMLCKACNREKSNK
ncbi:DUF262 domain-containing protein [Anaerococcus sp.]|uniref:GmrSD restriction endonuclease domain-containing protein n=1 Tax=Anaerococcus sp. TaxID=1872515 RepID=UPI00280AA5D9|nr:DUF262 domain-containing protein [Anaerococcus sp.]MDU3176659.1 DUF262 domain-containing protein [Anaerococcus sp.]